MNKESHSIVYKPVSGLASRHKLGSVLEGRIFGFPDLMTAVDYESLGYWGDVPYSGVVVVGETVGDYEIRPLSENIQDLYTIANKMRIIGVIEFVNGIEVR